MTHSAYYSPNQRRYQRGVSLIELMVGMVLGLIVVGAAGSIFLSNKQTYNATETLGRIQENGRIAFELMARDIREAGSTACGNNIPIANVLNTPGDTFNWGDGLRGYEGNMAAALAPFGTGAGQRVNGTQAIELRSSASGGVTVTKHVPSSAVVHVNTANHGFEPGDVLIICDYSQATIFEMTPGGAVLHIGHNTGNSGEPSGGNSCKALSFPVDPDCKDKPKDGKQYDDNAVVAKLHAAIWYIGNNSRGGRSLYRRVAGRDAEEITEGVQNMTLTYLEPGNDYRTASSISLWSDVAAVRVGLNLQAVEGALRSREITGVDGDALNRQLAHVVTLRGRNP
ncbi:prepilin-type N-terminal cleavage/methylation domain-containing protein [Marilutibacter alkalisoli]|uniref:Prepilin-type N-terminal cleavage/methylation domain-containing protein n=1 Tax=Marilutibacter alkalisoli TaxID=2591633 RepID=A0A514BPW7_9GAMM|nr:prepilin-type N-terminal cleavage/methylation domain-containing protein [Lysobacter alkalisoli]QDH69430.1 prepilin-type N-terminal cleavage/methylation domain-containing protein [Lysobacter alkalisoli]